MNLQYYETMEDKSKEYITYLIEQILPQFTQKEIETFLEDINTKSTKGKKSPKPKSAKGFVIIGNDTNKLASFSKLNEQQMKDLFQIYISRERNDRFAVRWRFYQYLKFVLDLNVKLIKFNQDPNPERILDFIVETEEKEVIIVICKDLLELTNFNDAINEITRFAKKQNLIPDRIIFATSKSFRNIPIDIPVKIISKEIKPELLVEYIEENRHFKKEDLLVVNNSDLKVAGFNFVSTEDLLNYVYKNSNGGQISIYRQLDFFVETTDEEPEVDLIWKGIMLK
ncbi:MAG: hypothetical protein ACXABO_01980 [Promethearchaeota archaeon]